MKKLILSDTHKELGAKMVDFAGYYMPVQYEGVKAEHENVRNNVGIFDVSHMGEVFVRGEKSLDFLQYITSNDVSKLSPGDIQYTCLLNSQGGIVDDLLLYMISEINYLLVLNASNIEKDIAWINKNNSFDCIVDNQSENYSLLAVQGPKTIKLLKELTYIDLDAIKYYNFKYGSIGNIDDILISRTGYTGEDGFELYVKNEFVKELWNSLFNTSIKISPIGLAARDTLRLEKGYCLYGNELNEETSPIEAGLSWITKSETKFISYKKIALQKKNGITKKLIAFYIKERGIARKNYPVLDSNGNKIGHVTSGSISPTLKKAIGLAYVIPRYSNIGTEIFITIRKKNIKAEITSVPFIK